MTTYGGPTPGAVTWFKVYCGLLCVTYLLVVLFCVPFFVWIVPESDMPAPLAVLFGGLMLGVGLVCLVACFLPFVLQPKPWVWVYDLVIICLGLTSACFMVFSIPLLIFWLKPEVRRYFGREPV